jgi:hypothetical protein
VATTSRLLEDDDAQVAEEFGDWLVGFFQSVFFSFGSERGFFFPADKLMHKAQRSYHQSRGPPSMGDLAYGINPVSF